MFKNSGSDYEIVGRGMWDGGCVSVYVRKLTVFSSRIDLPNLKRGLVLLTVETEVNGDSKRTNERGPSFVGSLGLSCRYKRFCPAVLGCSSPPSTKYFFFSLCGQSCRVACP